MTSALGSLILRARRRHLVNLVLDQATFAATLATGAFILLLILGTQILDWYWPALVFAASLAVGLYRVRQGLLSHYQVAQRTDARLGSHDLLSTAWYFAQAGPAGRAEPWMVERQRAAAERFASTVDIAAASPFTLPRMAWTGLALAGIALGLFGIRYGIRHSLSLARPLVAVHLDSFFTPKPQLAALPKSAVEKHLEDQIRALGVNAEDLPNAPGENAELQVPVTTSEPSEGDKPMLSKDNRVKPDEKGVSPDEGSDSAEGDQASQASKSPDDREASSESSSSPAGPAGKSSTPPPDSKQGQNQSGENSNLMDKMRDAMANLLQKLKMQPKSGGQQQTASNQQSQKGGKLQEQSGQKGKEGQGKSQAEGQPNADPNGEQQGEGGDPSQGQNKPGEHGSERPGPQDSKSGIGKQDGDKDIRDAQQLAAMGKISELIGKRSANINGEVTVEVLSGKQQSLRTALSHQVAAHAEAGGESNRDEIPLAYQHYVQQYFEQVRKSAAAQAKAKGAGN